CDAAETTHHTAVSSSSVYTASEPLPSVTNVVDRPGPRAATQAAIIPATGPPTRRPISASGTISSVLATQVRATVPRCGSENSLLARPIRNGISGGKWVSGWPLRTKPWPWTIARPDRRNAVSSVGGASSVSAIATRMASPPTTAPVTTQPNGSL